MCRTSQSPSSPSILSIVLLNQKCWIGNTLIQEIISTHYVVPHYHYLTNSKYFIVLREFEEWYQIIEDVRFTITNSTMLCSDEINRTAIKNDSSYLFSLYALWSSTMPLGILTVNGNWRCSKHTISQLYCIVKFTYRMTSSTTTLFPDIYSV